MLQLLAAVSQGDKMNQLQLLTTVNAFYDQAFNKLLIVTFGLIAFIGLFIPIAVGWLQLRTLRAEKNSLKRELQAETEVEKGLIRAEIDLAVAEKVGELRAEYERKFSDLGNELKRATAAAEGRSFHLQGNSLKQRKQSALAVEDYCHAVRNYIEARDEANAQRCLRQLINDCLPDTTSDKYVKFKLEANCKNLLKALRAANTNRRYENDIEALESAMEEASKRIPSPPATAKA